jgi:hypothetical protein
LPVETKPLAASQGLVTGKNLVKDLQAVAFTVENEHALAQG